MEHESAPSIVDPTGRRRDGKATAGPLELELAGASIEQCAVDHALTLSIWRGSAFDTDHLTWTLRLECAFSVCSSAGDMLFARDEETGAELAPAIERLLWKEVKESRVLEDGTLVLVLTDENVLEAPSDPHYESWQLSGSDGALVVCAPGGSLALWSPDELA